LAYTALIFDPGDRGKSRGEPRCQENPIAKIEDRRGTVDYLGDRAESMKKQLLGEDWSRRLQLYDDPARPMRSSTGSPGTSAPVDPSPPGQCPRHESNMRTRFRKPLLYPLSYGG